MSWLLLVMPMVGAVVVSLLAVLLALLYWAGPDVGH